MSLSPTERIELGLDDPPDTGSEFLPAARPNGVPVPPSPQPNLKLVLKGDDKVTAPKIRLLVNELLAGNMANADWALKQLFAANPKAALELYLEFAQFSLPQLKAVAVQVDDRSDSPKAMTFMQLQQMLTQD
jgi:hypothetical protein